MLILVRHGATSLNETGRVQGSTDASLSERGREQVFLLSEWLDSLGVEISEIYTSTARRAIETANILASRLGVSASTNPNFRERDFGPFEGLDRPAVLAKRGLDETAPIEIIEQWSDVAGVETDAAIRERALSDLRETGFLQRCRTTHGIVVSHAGVIEVLVNCLLDLPHVEQKWFKIPPASSVGVTIHEHGSRLVHLWPNPVVTSSRT